MPRSPKRRWLLRLAAAGDLAGTAQVIVIVDLHPVHGPDRRDGDLAATVGELLVAVLVVQAGIAAPGRLQRAGQRGGGTRPDERRADVLAVSPRGVHLLRDPGEQPGAVDDDLHLLGCQGLDV